MILLFQFDRDCGEPGAEVRGAAARYPGVQTEGNDDDYDKEDNDLMMTWRTSNMKLQLSKEKVIMMIKIMMMMMIKIMMMMV